MAGDLNCPFTQPSIPIPSRCNMEVYSGITDRRLQVINWKPSTVGFHTRAKYGSRSCLDLVFASRDIAESVTQVIDELLTFDSDHFSLHITVHTKAALKAKQTTRERKTYPWSQEMDSTYHSITDPLLPAWNELKEEFLARVPLSSTERRSQVHHITQVLSDIMVNQLL
jgi:hypothetical protein